MNKDIAEFEEYFEKAIQWLRAQPSPLPNGELAVFLINIVGGLIVLIKESRK